MNSERVLKHPFTGDWTTGDLDNRYTEEMKKRATKCKS